MFELQSETLCDSPLGYSIKTTDVEKRKYSVIYNHDKFNEFATDFIMFSNLVPNMKEFGEMNKKIQDETLTVIAKHNLHKISHEMTRLLNLTTEYLKTDYMKDLMKLYSLYYSILY